MRSERRASACCKKYALSIRRINKIKKPSCKTQLGFCYIKLQLRQSQTNLYLPEYSGKSAGGTHCYVRAVRAGDAYFHAVESALIREVVGVKLRLVFFAARQKRERQIYILLALRAVEYGQIPCVRAAPRKYCKLAYFAAGEHVRLVPDYRQGRYK